jgi:hypothetical protein
MVTGLGPPFTICSWICVLRKADALNRQFFQWRKGVAEESQRIQEREEGDQQNENQQGKESQQPFGCSFFCGGY